MWSLVGYIDNMHHTKRSVRIQFAADLVEADFVWVWLLDIGIICWNFSL